MQAFLPSSLVIITAIFFSSLDTNTNTALGYLLSAVNLQQSTFIITSCSVCFVSALPRLHFPQAQQPTYMATGDSSSQHAPVSHVQFTEY